MPKQNKEHHYFYLDNRDKILKVNEHYEGCYCEHWSVPISECSCNCYEEQIFMIGCEAMRDQFYGGSDHG